MKVVYCSNCGTRLNLSRKALPKFGRILDIVEWHKCPAEPVELDLTPIDIPEFKPTKGKDKFVKNLNDLTPPPLHGPVSTMDLRDRRKSEDVKSDIASTAPASILDQLKAMQDE